MYGELFGVLDDLIDAYDAATGIHFRKAMDAFEDMMAEMASLKELLKILNALFGDKTYPQLETNLRNFTSFVYLPLKKRAKILSLLERGPPMFKFSHKGNFEKTSHFLQGAQKLKAQKILEKYGRAGVAALSSATPVDTGETANAWSYRVTTSRNGYSIQWMNSNSNEGVPIVILLQYGHATGTGGYVEGRDFINPAIKPIFDQISENISQEIANL